MPYNYDHECIFTDGKPYKTRGMTFDKDELSFLRHLCYENGSDLSELVNEAINTFFNRYSDIENVFNCLSYNFVACSKWDGIENINYFPYYGIIGEGEQTSLDISFKNYKRLKKLKYYFGTIYPIAKNFKEDGTRSREYFYEQVRNNCRALTDLEKVVDTFAIELPTTESGWIRLIIRTVLISSCGFTTSKNPTKFNGKYKNTSKGYYTWYINYILDDTKSRIKEATKTVLEPEIDLEPMLKYCKSDIKETKKMYKKFNFKGKRKKE